MLDVDVACGASRPRVGSSSLALDRSAVRFLWGAAFVLGVSACAPRPPASIDLVPIVPITVADAQARDIRDQVVRWGGTLVSTTIGPDETCFEVVSRPLDRQARPLPTDDTEGRFVACALGFYDPAVYATGRDITVVGTLTGLTSGKIGEREYSFPKVAADAVYLWPKRVTPQVVYYPAWVGPYWYGYPYPYWGPWGPWGPWPYW